MDEAEEGEIIGGGGDDDARDGGCSGNHVTLEASLVQQSQSVLEPSQVHACLVNGVVEMTHGENNELNTKDAPIETSDRNTIVTERVMDSSFKTHVPNLGHSTMGSPKPSSFLKSLAQSGCFGPFPSKVITPSASEQPVEN